MTLADHLTRLEQRDLIRPAQPGTDWDYLFRHVLVQDAAYATLVRAERGLLHQAVGEALERLYADQVDSHELAPRLAHHFHQAGDAGRALKYFALAGDDALRRYANAEAAMHFTRALEVALPDLPDPGQVARLYTNRGRALELAGQFEEALHNYDEFEMFGQRRADFSMELAALMARTTLHATLTPLFDPVLGQEYSDRALALARELGDRGAEAKILWNLLLLHYYAGRLPESIQYGEQSLAIARELDLREQTAYSLHNLSMSLMATGETRRARAMLQEAQDLWHELNNLSMLAENLLMSANADYFAGDHVSSQAMLDEAYRLSQASNNGWIEACSRWRLGYLSLENGDAYRATRALEDAIRLGEQLGLSLVHVGSQAALAWVHASLGSIETGLALARQAASLAEVERWPQVYKSWVTAILARIAVLGGELGEAEAAIRAGYDGLDRGDFTVPTPVYLGLAEAELALARGEPEQVIALTNELDEMLGRIDLRSFLAETLYLKGRALLVQGRLDQALDALEPARAAAEASGTRRGLWPILDALSEVEVLRGNPAEARALRSQAREIVGYIADHAGAADLRTAFTRLPRVRTLLAQGLRH